MVCPVTNCSPIMRIAMSTPRRITGSPPRAISRFNAAVSPLSSTEPTSLPVTTNPQVAALTNIEALWPTCARQSPSAILSRISASRVKVSGMRSSASARHISATPSWLDRSYSRTNPLHGARGPFRPQRLDQPARRRLRLLGHPRPARARLRSARARSPALAPYNAR